MEKKYFTLVTDIGIREMMDAISRGDKVHITEFAVGDGGGGYYVPSQEMDALRHEVWRSGISECKVDQEAGNILVVEAVMPPEAGGFTIREMGVFDNAGQLIAVSNAPDTQKAGLADGAVQELRLNMKIELSNMDAITLTVDPAASVSKAELEAHQNDTGTHITPEERSKWNAKQDAMTVDSTLSSTSKNPVQNRTVKAALDGKAGTGHTHSAASATASGFMSSADKKKLNGIDENANNYTHPSTHPASMVNQDATHRFVTDAEKQAWDALYAQLVAYTDGAIADLIGGAPATLDTLKEIADAIAANKSTEQALNEAIGKKASQAELDTHTGNNIIHVTATDKQGWNKDIAEREVAFTQAATRANIVSREKVKVLLGKIRKWFADMKAVAFTGSYTDLINKPEIPSAVRVKGDAEKDYRVGDVNLTAENIGAPSIEYIKGSFAPGHTSTAASDFEYGSWYRVARFSEDIGGGGTPSLSGTSCFVTIKAGEGGEGQYSAVQVIGGAGGARLILATHSGGNTVQYIRYVYDSRDRRPCLDMFCSGGRVRVSISDAAGAGGRWECIEPVAADERPDGVVYGILKLGGSFDLSSLAMADGSNADKFVLKKQCGANPGWNTAYRDLADYYSHDGTPKYYRIKIPNIQDTWAMLYMELSFRQSHSEGKGGKLMITARHNSTAPYTWTDVKCAVIGTLGENIGVFASDGMYFYISGGLSYSAISVDRILAGDSIRYRDLSDVVVDVVDSLPETYQTAVVEYTVSKGYLESHFVPDYVKQKGMVLGSVGWKKIAVFSGGKTGMASCIIDIKREYMTAKEEYHRFFLCAVYGRCEFVPILDRAESHLITKARVITGAAGKCCLEVYYNYENINHVNLTIENAVSTEYNNSETIWNPIDPENDTDTPSAGTVAAEYNIPINFNTTMLAKKDGSNVSGAWGGLAAGSVLGTYDSGGNLGRKPPSYIGDGRAKFRMMRGFKGLDDPPSFMDCLLMNTYTDSTQKFVTALGLAKTGGAPRAYIAAGDASAGEWKSQAELVTAGWGGMAGDMRTPVYISDGRAHACHKMQCTRTLFEGVLGYSAGERMLLGGYSEDNQYLETDTGYSNTSYITLRITGGCQVEPKGDRNPRGFVQEVALVRSNNDIAYTCGDPEWMGEDIRVPVRDPASSDGYSYGDIEVKYSPYWNCSSGSSLSNLLYVRVMSDYINIFKIEALF